MSSSCSWKHRITAIGTHWLRSSTTDAEFVNVTDLWWHTRDELRSAHAYGLTRIFKDSSLQATDIRGKRLSDEIAVVHARMTLTGQTSVGEITTPRPRSNVMSFVGRANPVHARVLPKIYEHDFSAQRLSSQRRRVDPPLCP